jgi:hypothetical protein
MIWSKSSMLSYNQCAKRFFYEYIERRTPEVGFDHLTRGTMFHDTVEHFFAKLDKKKLLKLLESEVKEDIEDYFRSIIVYNDKIEGLNHLYDNMVISETKRAMQCYLVKKKKALEYYYPVYSEKEIVNQEKGWRGKIDWIFKTFDEEYAIGEIKTGKIGDLSEIRKELCFLTLLTEGMNILPKEPKYIMCYYPKSNDILFEIPKKVSFNALSRAYTRAVDGLAQADFPKNISTLCLYCSFAQHCLGGEGKIFSNNDADLPETVRPKKKKDKNSPVIDVKELHKKVIEKKDEENITA